MSFDEDRLAYWCAAMAGEDPVEEVLRYRPIVSAVYGDTDGFSGTDAMARAAFLTYLDTNKPANLNGRRLVVIAGRG